mgnify:CR=1 FL=1
MLIRKPADLRYSDVTPRNLYVNRRRFLAAGSAALGSLTLPAPGRAAGAKIPNVVKSNYKVDEKINSYEDITTYNNYYEFGLDKSDPALGGGKRSSAEKKGNVINSIDAAFDAIPTTDGRS